MAVLVTMAVACIVFVCRGYVCTPYVCALCAHSYVHIAGYAFTSASLLYTAASANRGTTSQEHISYTAGR